MKPTSGPFVARGMRSMRDPFSKATLVLTAYYTAGIFVVLVAMNMLMYGLFIKNLHIEPHGNRIVVVPEERGESTGEEEIENSVSEEVRENLIETLFYIDILVVLAGAGIGYLLARGALRPIRISYERQKRFVSDAAHELRTPLSVLKAATESSLERERTNTEYIRALKDILDETNMLTTLTDDLLLFSRVERMPVVHKENVHFSEVVATEVRRIGPYAEKRHISLHTDLNPDIHVAGDTHLLKRVCINLLKNAVDYNKDGGEISITLSTSGTQCLLSMKDTGVGIAPSDLHRIFDPFFKASTSRKAVYGHGSGLGLSIVKESIEAHGGSIQVTSDVGKGTVVTVSLPLFQG